MPQSVRSSKRLSKRLSKKPRRYKTTSEEEVSAKKIKHVDEEKAKKKVSSVMQNIRTTFKNVSTTEENTVCNLAQNMHQKTVKNFYSFKANNTNTPSQVESNITQPTIQLYNVQNLENDERQLLNLPSCHQSFQNIAFNNMNNTRTPSQKFSINKNSSQCVTRRESNITTGNITQPNIQLYNVQHLANDETQLLNNSPRRQQSFQNIACNNPSKKLNHTQTLGNTEPVEPLQENNAPLLRRENDVQIEILRDLQQKIQEINKRLDSMEQKIDGNICNAMPMKPRIFPFSNIDAIRMFTKEDSVLYNEVVNYFKFLNCMTLKDSVHQCVKEAITIQVAQQLTWWGINDKFAFYNTVLCQAIYQAVGSNRYYPKPTREEFQKEVVASLKVAKQRLRNAIERHPGIQGRRQKLQAAADALYNDEENISNHEDDENQSKSGDSDNIRDMENESDDSGEHS